MAHGGAAATPRGPSRVESAWARDIAARSGRFAAPLLRRGAGLPGLGAGAFSRAVRRGLVMPRALVRPRLATATAADRARPPLPFLVQHAEMGLSHHHLYTLLGWLASHYDVGGEYTPGARPGRALRSGTGNLSLADLEALLSGAIGPAGGPTAARARRQPRVPAAPRPTPGLSVTADFMAIPAALRFAQDLTTTSRILPAHAGVPGGREAGDPGDAMSPFGSIIAGPWLATRTRRAAARVPAIRPPTEMVRSPQVVEHLSAASGDAMPTASPSGARREPAPSRRTLSWSAATLRDDQPGRHRLGAAPLDHATWAPPFLTVGALSLAAGFDSPEAAPGFNAPAMAIRRHPMTPVRSLPVPFGLAPSIRRTAMTGAATLDRQQRAFAPRRAADSTGRAASQTAPVKDQGAYFEVALLNRLQSARGFGYARAGVDRGRRPGINQTIPSETVLGSGMIAAHPHIGAERRAMNAPRARPFALSRDVFFAPDTVRSRDPRDPAVLDQALAHAFQPSSALVDDRSVRPALAARGGTDSIANSGFDVARASRSRPAASAVSATAAAVLPRLDSRAPRAARAHPLLAASALAPVVRPMLTPARLSVVSPPAGLFSLTLAQTLPVASVRPALSPPMPAVTVPQRLARRAAPSDAAAVLVPAAIHAYTAALVPAAVHAYVEDDPLARSGGARLFSVIAQESRASAADAGVTPRPRSDHSATTARVTPAAEVRPLIHGRYAADAAMAWPLPAPTGRYDRQRVAATPFGALSRTLALVARIQRAPGALSLRASAAMAGIPIISMAPLSGARRRGHNLVHANARASLLRERRDVTSDAGWPVTSTGAGVHAFTPGRDILTRGASAFTPGTPSFTPGTGTLAFAPGRDVFFGFNSDAVWPRALTRLPNGTLAHTHTPSVLAPRGILSGSAAGGGRLTVIAAGRRRPAGFHLAAAGDLVDDRMAVPALSARRSAASPPVAGSGAARVAGESWSGSAQPLWRHGVGSQSFVGRGVGVERLAARAAAWPTAVIEPPNLGAHARREAPALTPVPRRALTPAARAAAALASHLNALSFGLTVPHATALSSPSRLISRWPGRADFQFAALTRGGARRSRSQDGISPADYGQALPSPRPALVPISHAAPVAQRLTVSVALTASTPTLVSATTAATPALVPAAGWSPAAGIGAMHGAAPEGATTAGGLTPSAAVHPFVRGGYLPRAAVAQPLNPLLFAPVTAGWRIPWDRRHLASPTLAGWKPAAPGDTFAQPQLMDSPGYAPEDHRASTGTARVVPAEQRIGRRAEVAVPFAALSRPLPVATWTWRVAATVAGGATPRGRNLVSPGLVSLNGQVAAPGMRLGAVRAAMRDAGSGTRNAGSGTWSLGARTWGAGRGRANAGPAGLGGYGTDAMTASGSDPAGPTGGAFAAHPLGRMLAPLSRFLSPAWTAATAAPARLAQALPPRSFVTPPAAQPALLIQRKALAGAGEPSPLQRSIAVARTAHSAGRPLDAPARALMETALARDLAPIRLHTDAPAVQAAAAVGARAFTLGRDVFFAPGAYQPHSPAGLALLGHELVHAGQQQAAAQRHSAAGMAAISVASEPPALEAQAARTESSLLNLFSGRPLPVARQAAESGAGRPAARPAALPGHTAAPWTLSLGETPRALYHQPVAAIQRAVSLSGAVAPTALAGTSRGRAPVIGAARGGVAGAAARGLDGAVAYGLGGTAQQGSVLAGATAGQPAAAQAAIPGVEDLVTQVLRRVKQELRLDHERAGGYLSDLMR